MKIYKYVLMVADIQILDLPPKHKILKCTTQHGTIVLYILVDPDTTEKVEKHIYMFGTGHNVTRSKYIDTVMTNNETKVWHVYE